MSIKTKRTFRESTITIIMGITAFILLNILAVAVKQHFQLKQQILTLTPPPTQSPPLISITPSPQATETPNPKPRNVLELSQYQINLPKDYSWEEEVKGNLDVVSTGFCAAGYDQEWIDEFRAPSCQYFTVKGFKNPNTRILVSDSKLPGGGGGFITTNTESIKLGPPNYEADFSVEWEGEKTKDYLYYINGCLRKDLCILANNTQKYEFPRSADYIRNQQIFIEEFKQLVNSLQISSRD